MTENRSPAQHAVADHLRLLTTGRLDAWAELYTADATFTFPFAPPGMASELHGREALVTHMRNFVATFDVQAVNLRYIATTSPQIAVALWTLDGTATPTGKHFDRADGRRRADHSIRRLLEPSGRRRSADPQRRRGDRNRGCCRLFRQLNGANRRSGCRG